MLSFLFSCWLWCLPVQPFQALLVCKIYASSCSRRPTPPGLFLIEWIQVLQIVVQLFMRKIATEQIRDVVGLVLHSDKIQPLQFWSKARVAGMVLLLKMLVASWTALLTIKLLFWGGRIACRLKLLGCFLFEIQVQHLSRDHPDFAGWSFQGQACSVLEAVGVRAPFGHRWVRQYFFSSKC